jgi:hypothetical protein
MKLLGLVRLVDLVQIRCDGLNGQEGLNSNARQEAGTPRTGKNRRFLLSQDALLSVSLRRAFTLSVRRSCELRGQLHLCTRTRARHGVLGSTLSSEKEPEKGDSVWSERNTVGGRRNFTVVNE